MITLDPQRGELRAKVRQLLKRNDFLTVGQLQQRLQLSGTRRITAALDYLRGQHLISCNVGPEVAVWFSLERKSEGTALALSQAIALAKLDMSRAVNVRHGDVRPPATA